jgi:hypothetical protein
LDYLLTPDHSKVDLRRRLEKMAANWIAHFGADTHYRLAVLTRAGYSVEKCNSPAQLHALLTGIRIVDAVIVSEGDGDTPYDAISLTRSNSTIPLILFQSGNPHYDEAEFDLIVPVLTQPREWLNKVAALLARSLQQIR